MAVLLSGYDGSQHYFIFPLFIISTDLMVFDYLFCRFVCLYKSLSACLSVCLFSTTHVVGWMAAATELPSRS